MGQRNLAAQAHEQLLRRIVSFDLVPGTTLQERSLAEQMGMSRTPVREALQQLTHEGWVQNSQKRNVMEVRPLSEEDVLELLELRQMLELRGVEIIFDKKINERMAQHFRELVETMRISSENDLSCGDMEYMVSDLCFHTGLMMLQEQTRLYAFWKQMEQEFIRLGIMALRSRTGGRARVEEEHEAIISGIQLRRKKQVRAAIRYHNEQTKLHIFRSLEGILQR